MQHITLAELVQCIAEYSTHSTTVISNNIDMVTFYDLILNQAVLYELLKMCDVETSIYFLTLSRRRITQKMRQIYLRPTYMDCKIESTSNLYLPPECFDRNNIDIRKSKDVYGHFRKFHKLSYMYKYAYFTISIQHSKTKSSYFNISIQVQYKGELVVITIQTVRLDLNENSISNIYGIELHTENRENYSSTEYTDQISSSNIVDIILDTLNMYEPPPIEKECNKLIDKCYSIFSPCLIKCESI